MTSIKPHVKAVQHPNPTRRTFHVTREVTEGGCDRYGFGDYFFALNKEKPSELVEMLMERLQAIPGVTSAHFQPYEISVGIGEAFDWMSIGPIVVGEIVNVLFPETLGKTIEVSAEVGWSYYVRSGSRMWDDKDDGHRVKYKDTVKRETVEVKDPHVLDIERFLNPNAVEQAQQKAASEVVTEE